MTRPSIDLYCEGNASVPGGAFSGTAYCLLAELRKHGFPVRTFDCEPAGTERKLLLAKSFRMPLRAWRSNFRFSRLAFEHRSEIANRIMRREGAADIIMLIGATLLPDVPKGHPVILYNDWNAALATRFAHTGFSPMPALSAQQHALSMEQEQRVYDRASLNFTISEHLRQSFIDDWGMAPEAVHTVYAGPNLVVPPADGAPSPEQTAAPSVLFVGKEFERKGGPLLVQAFAEVRRHVPDARLVIVGPKECPAVAAGVPGIDFVGRLDKKQPDQLKRLLDLYRYSTVFSLPTLYEPFGIAVVEAMMSGLPTVVSDFWALTEIVEDGITGFNVPTGSAEGLAARLIELLRDRERAAAMGARARERAQALFTWERAGQRMAEEIAKL